VRARWGLASPLDLVSPGIDVLVSLKALRLTDFEILSGLSTLDHAVATDRQASRIVAIARFLAPAGSPPQPPARIVDAAGIPWTSGRAERLCDSRVTVGLQIYRSGG
jgi:hypothetical protein